MNQRGHWTDLSLCWSWPMIEALLIAQTVIYVLGIGGLARWVYKWINALKGVVEAQQKTIDAQKVWLEGFVNFLNIADAPKMAERYEAFKKMVDHEKDVFTKQYEREFQKEKTELLESSANL